MIPDPPHVPLQLNGKVVGYVTDSTAFRGVTITGACVVPGLLINLLTDEPSPGPVHRLTERGFELGTKEPMTAFSHTTFTYTKDLILSLVKCYRCNKETLHPFSGAIDCAIGLCGAPITDYPELLRVVERIRNIEEGRVNTHEGDRLAQWIMEGLRS